VHIERGTHCASCALRVVRIAGAWCALRVMRIARRAHPLRIVRNAYDARSRRQSVFLADKWKDPRSPRPPARPNPPRRRIFYSIDCICNCEGFIRKSLKPARKKCCCTGMHCEGRKIDPRGCVLLACHIVPRDK
jgi:hypothetical protein